MTQQVAAAGIQWQNIALDNLGSLANLEAEVLMTPNAPLRTIEVTLTHHLQRGTSQYCKDIATCIQFRANSYLSLYLHILQFSHWIIILTI